MASRSVPAVGEGDSTFLDEYERSESLVAHSSEEGEEDNEDHEGAQDADLYDHSGDDEDSETYDDEEEEGYEDINARRQTERAIDQKLDDLEAYILTHTKGSLEILDFGKDRYSAKVTVRFRVSRGDNAEWKALDAAERETQRKRDNGAVSAVRGAGHPSFEPYWKTKKFIKPEIDSRYGFALSDQEDALLFDPEIYPEYTHLHPGTVTLDGYALDCWEWEVLHGGGNTHERLFVPAHSMPGLKAAQLLRRVVELQSTTRVQDLGWDDIRDEADLIEVTGQGGVEGDVELTTSLLCGILNRRDVFINLADKMSIAQEWTSGIATDEVLGRWNFMWQMVVAHEVARRLASGQAKGGSNQFSVQVLASLIISEQWLRNVEQRLDEDAVPVPEGREVSEEERGEAEEIMRLAEKCMQTNAADTAANVLLGAVDIDPTNIGYRLKRCEALCAHGAVMKKLWHRTASESARDDSLQCYDVAAVNAVVLTKLAPENVQCCAILGKAQLGRGYAEKAAVAYKRAMSLANNEMDKEAFLDGLVEARALLLIENTSIEKEQDPVQELALRKEIENRKYDILSAQIVTVSRVHEQQEEGLIEFAKSIKWPYLDEATTRIKSAYAQLHSGGKQELPSTIHDWLYGLTLPGKWFAYNVMTALVKCTSSLTDSLGVSPGQYFGLVLPGVSYWRDRGPLGRVLAALPAVNSLTGWIGPCPPVTVEIGNATEEQKNKPRWVNVLANPVSRNFERPEDPEPMQFDEYREDIDTFAAEIKDENNWKIVDPPGDDDNSHCELKSILIRPNRPDDEADEPALDYRATLSFLLNDANQVDLPLRTNPVFVVPPRCYPAGPAGHAMHTRQAEYFKSVVRIEVWTADKLTFENEPPGSHWNDSLIVINATGKGTEVLARAWCATHARNAVIRTAGGPCYKCALLATRQLKMDVMIWCSGT
ncbi:hypothetical protein BJX64DRAFT_299733 [Aspergillus heterothallicus]